MPDSIFKFLNIYNVGFSFQQYLFSRISIEQIWQVFQYRIKPQVYAIFKLKFKKSDNFELM